MSPTLSQSIQTLAEPGADIFGLLRYATVIMEAQISKQEEVKDG
jgi:hypothetical protein